MKLHHKIAARFGYDLVRIAKRHETVTDHLRNLFKTLDVNVVIDVGANVGQYGGSLREAGYTGRIASFEPVSASFARLEEAARDDPDWQVYRRALGKSAATQTIHITESSVFSSFHEPNAYGQERFKKSVPVVGAEEVKVRTLDSQFDRLVEGIAEPRVYLKLDTQGHDLEVLGGAAESVSRVCGMQSEISVTPIYEGMPHYLTSLSQFESLGFEITGIYPVSRDKKSLAIIEFDCVMRRGTDS